MCDTLLEQSLGASCSAVPCGVQLGLVEVDNAAVDLVQHTETVTELLLRYGLVDRLSLLFGSGCFPTITEKT